MLGTILAVLLVIVLLRFVLVSSQNFGAMDSMIVRDYMDKVSTGSLEERTRIVKLVDGPACSWMSEQAKQSIKNAYKRSLSAADS